MAARCPWITCVVRLSSYECGMDQPTYTPTQKIVEATGTLFFKFGDLDSTKPAGGVKIRDRDHCSLHGEVFGNKIMRQKLAYLSPNCPLGPLPSFEEPGVIEPEVIPEEAGVAQPVSASAS